MPPIRVVTIIICLLPAGIAGCLGFDPDDLRLDPGIQTGIACDEEPTRVHEERGRAVSPAIVGTPLAGESSGSVALTLHGENETRLTWVLGRFGIAGTPNLLYRASFWLAGPEGVVWEDQVSGTTSGYQSSSETVTVGPGTYHLGWSVEGAGTEYRIIVEEGPCMPIQVFP